MNHEAFQDLLNIGNLMSNICFNHSQESWPPPDARCREQMGHLQRRWDEARSRLGKVRKPRKRKVATDAKP